MTTIVYRRVSSDQQTTASQEADLLSWVDRHGEPVEWPDAESFTGKTMRRPIWDQVWHAIERGHVKTLVVWRLDRLGRTAAGLTRLFEELLRLGVNLVSIKDGIDLSTPAGRLMANVIASVAQYETEVRSERQRAGIEAKRNPKTGKCPWGGSKKNSRGVKARKQAKIMELFNQGLTYGQIGASLRLHRTTVMRIVRRQTQEQQPCNS